MNFQTLLNRLLTYLGKLLTIDAHYIAKGGSWLLFEQIINNGTSFILAVIFARVLTQPTYGTYNYIHSILGILALLALPGMNTAINQAVARGFDRAIIPAFKLKLQWSLLGSLACLVFALTNYFQNNWELSGVFVIIAFFFPLMYSPIVYDAYLQGKKHFKTAAIFESIYQLSNMLAIIVIIQLTHNLIAIFFAFAFTLSALRLLFYRLSLIWFPPNQQLDPQTLSFGKHVSLINVLGVIASYLDRLLIYTFLGPVELAIYSFAILPIDKASNVFDNIPALAMPKLSGKPLGDIQKNLGRRLVQMFVLGILLTLGYLLIAPLLFQVFFPTYLESIPLSRIFSLILIGKLPVLFLSALGQAKMTLYPKKIMYLGSLLPQVGVIILLFVLGKIYGIYGIVAARILFYAIAFSISLWCWQYIFKKHPKTAI